MFYNAEKGLWQEYIYVDGKRKRLSAKRKADLVRKIQSQADKQEHGELFSTVADLWEESHAEKVESTTAGSYKPQIKRMAEFFDGQRINDITPAECQAFIDELARMGYARDTVSRAKHILNRIFNYAITLPGSTLRYNPVAAVQTPRGLPHTRREPPTEDQLIRINPDTEMGLFACFLLYTGLRRGELLALQWEDLDMKEKVLTVSHVIQYDTDKGHLKESPKTEAGFRTVPLPDVLIEILPKDKKRGFIFGGDTWFSNMRFNRQWLEWCKEVGLAEKEEIRHTAANGHTYTKVKWHALVTPHQFRHQYATDLFHAGVDELDTKSIMGHSSIVVTRDIYQHIGERDKESQAAKKLNEYYSQKGKTDEKEP